MTYRETMTYRELLNELKQFTPEQLDQDVTIHVSGVDEFYALVGDYPIVESNDTCDVLDPGHKYLCI